MKTFIRRLLPILLVLLLLSASVMAEAPYAPGEWPGQKLRNMSKAERGVYEYNYWRNDIPDDDDSILPKNFRMMTSPFHEFDEYGEGTDIDPDAQIDMTGLDTLPASASGSFNERQFSSMVDAIRAVHDGPIYDIDLRRETHGLMNEHAVTWYSKYNLYMIELTDEEADAKAEEFLRKAVGTTQVLYDPDTYPDPSATIPVEVQTVTTEKELCEKYGVEYVHIPATDHLWPTDAQIDMFIDLVRALPENAWLHIHCSAGKGRTTTFLALYDMMRNPGVSLQDIASRQAALGTMYVLNGGNGSSWHSPYDDERALMMPYLYEYVQAAHEGGFEMSWSAYRETQGF